ncbi:MAG: low temperature requirement protein A [Acidimicrobiia bacterium]|nr:low temperature requirement protein A [Acidimicrobiia bacterium]
MKKTMLRPPRLRTLEEDSEERKVTWTELFYDLVFVVAVAGLGHRLLEDSSWTGFWSFAGLFVPLWWAWAGFTFYADRYDTDDLGQRLLAVAQMVAVALMAASISGGAAEPLIAYALSFVAARSILIVMYLRARRHVAETRDLVTGYTKGMSLAVVFWLVSVFVPEPFRYVLWAIGLAVDFATPYRMRRVQAKVPLDVAHLPERFGLFTILVLGESIAAVVAGLEEEVWTSGATVVAVFAVLITTGLWWIYFDNLDGTVVRRLEGQQKAWKPTAWIYGHLPLVIALIMTAIGLEHAIVAVGHHGLEAGERWLLAGGLAMALATLALIHAATTSGEPGSASAVRQTWITRLRLAGAALVLISSMVLGGGSPIVFVAALAVVCGLQVAGDIVIIDRISR